MDDLGNRMKDHENITRFYLPKKTHLILRLDGKSFHTYTKSLHKPFDQQLMADLDDAAYLVYNEIQGARALYVQSDEVSIVFDDLQRPESQQWFGGNLQKIVSVSASLMTAKFNHLRKGNLAYFDARAFSIASSAEVVNYFVWRTKDCIRNSISAVGQSFFSHKDLHGVPTNQVLGMLKKKDVVWEEDYTNRERCGFFMVGKNIHDIPTIGLYDFYKNSLGLNQS